MEIEKAVAPEEKKPATFLNLVHIALDTYGDIFSDFDPSPYSSRILSDDFLKEVQKRYVENRKGDFEVRFSLPHAQRSAKTEGLVKKRLKDYFTMQLKGVDYEIGKLRKNGWMHLIAGFVILAADILFATYSNNYGTLLKLAEILLVPLGWYNIWIGIDRVSEIPSKLEDQKKFYEKFKNAAYLFVSEEEIVQQIEETAAKAEAPKQAEQPKTGEKKPTAEEKKQA